MKEKRTEEQDKCPICGGKGVLTRPRKKALADRAHLVELLSAKGYSYREIAKVLNLKSTNAVSRALHKTTK